MFGEWFEKILTPKEGNTSFTFRFYSFKMFKEIFQPEVISEGCVSLEPITPRGSSISYFLFFGWNKSFRLSAWFWLWGLEILPCTWLGLNYRKEDLKVFLRQIKARNKGTSSSTANQKGWFEHPGSNFSWEHLGKVPWRQSQGVPHGWALPGIKEEGGVLRGFCISYL